MFKIHCCSICQTVQSIIQAWAALAIAQGVQMNPMTWPIYIYTHTHMYGHVLQPKPKMYGILAQRAQYNKFVECGSKNQALMNLTMASMDLKDDQVRTKKIELNEFTVRGGIQLYKSITVGYKYNSDCYSILSLFSDPFLMEDLLHYIVPFGRF